MMDFHFNSSEVSNNLAQLSTRLEAGLRMYGETASQSLESYAKEHRPWTDRTSRARQGLTGSSEAGGATLRIVLAHTVDYGLWLELAHEKNYAIVEPTVRLQGNTIIDGLQGLLDKVRV